MTVNDEIKKEAGVKSTEYTSTHAGRPPYAGSRRIADFLNGSTKGAPARQLSKRAKGFLDTRDNSSEKEWVTKGRKLALVQ